MKKEEFDADDRKDDSVAKGDLHVKRRIAVLKIVVHLLLVDPSTFCSFLPFSAEFLPVVVRVEARIDGVQKDGQLEDLQGHVDKSCHNLHHIFRS